MSNSAAAADPALLQLADAAGLAPQWQDVYGRMHEVKEPVLRSMLDALGLPCASPGQIAASLRQLGSEAQAGTGTMLIATVNEAPAFQYTGSPLYTLTLEDGKQYIGRASAAGLGRVSIPAIAQPGYHTLAIGELQITLAVTPMRCPSVADLAGRPPARPWGVAAQVYSLHRAPPRGPTAGAPAASASSIPVWPGWESGGDFAALAALARHAAHSGASALAISPVHAMFSADPQRYSPYAPSSRLFLNAAYIEPSIILGQQAVRQAVGQMDPGWSRRAAADSGRIDWGHVLPQRLGLLQRLFDNFLRHGPADLRQQFEAFRQRGGEALESHARYEALHAHHLAALGPASGWQDWPAELHDPRGQGVAAYAAAHEAEIGFHVFLQWLADSGMQLAQRHARAAGMPIGLIADLAIGTDPRGSHAWSRQGEMLAGVSVGAPPDLFQPRGQSWGLSAFSPRALRQTAYAAFIETLRAALAHAGGVRIDHILGLARMWLIPQAASPADGVYLRYPMDDMLRLLALEAWRHRAVVVGENLGTVPEGFNEALRRKGILGTGVLWFERAPETIREPDSESGRAREPEPKQAGSLESGAFVPASRWSPYAMATPTTHDLPTITGWWAGRDLEWRARLEQWPAEQRARQADARLHDKTALWQALLDAGCASEPASEPGAPPPRAAPRDAVLAFVGRTPSPLAIFPLEDLLGLAEQPNLPGSSGEGEPTHPNWTQRLPVAADEIFADADVARGIAAIKQARRRA